MSTQIATFRDYVTEKIKTFSADRTVFCCGHASYSFGMLDEMANRYTRHLLRMGIKKGCCVGYTMPNSPHLPALFMAISRIDACAVPVFHMIPDRGKAQIFSQCRVKAIITISSLCAPLKQTMQAMGNGVTFATIDKCDDADYPLPLVADVVDNGEGASADIDISADLPLLMAATSGTTGTPKFVAMTQRNVVAAMKAAEAMARCDIQNGYSSVAAFPLCTSGILVTMGMMFAGVNIIFSDDPSPVTFLQLMQHWNADSLSAPPSYYEAILSLPMLANFNRSSVKRIMTGMDFFSSSLMQRISDAFPNVVSAANGYGLVETSTVFMHWQAESREEFFADIRSMQLAPNCGNQIDVCDADGNSVDIGIEGELVVRGNCVVPGYLGNHADNSIAFNNGWFKTGDCAKKISPDAIVLLGRNKYLIKRGGKSVSPLSIQEHIAKLPQVLNCAVVGAPHPLYGQMIWGFIVIKKGCELTLKDIMKHCRETLPNYMTPDQIRFLAELPKHSGVGKLNMDALVELAKKELATMEGEPNVA